MYLNYDSSAKFIVDAGGFNKVVLDLIGAIHFVNYIIRSIVVDVYGFIVGWSYILSNTTTVDFHWSDRKLFLICTSTAS